MGFLLGWLAGLVSSAVIYVGFALWIDWRTRRAEQPAHWMDEMGDHVGHNIDIRIDPPIVGQHR